MGTAYLGLIRKIDEFIRKYYKNRLIKGALYCVALLGLAFIILNVLEYYSWFDTRTRTAFFYTFLGIAIFVLGRYIVVPITQLTRFGKIISYEQAAKIIGTHFAEVKDSLLNTLQLQQLNDQASETTDLLEASIDQKIAKLTPVPFASAIDLKKNRKYLPYALPPVLLILLTLVVAPSLVTEPTKRIVRHDEVFERPAPFQLEILNPDLKAVQQTDFTLNVKLTGKEIPDQLMIEVGGAQYKMDKENVVKFNYTIKNLQQHTKFVIRAHDFISKEYQIMVLPKPTMLSFAVQAVFPAYLQRKTEMFENTGDLTIPAGTVLTWMFYTRDVDEVNFRLNATEQALRKNQSNVFTYTTKLLANSEYRVGIKNAYFANKDSLSYGITVIPDLFPSISVTEQRDSIYDNRLYFNGQIKDDYGFSRLTFNYLVKKKDTLLIKPELKSKDVSMDPKVLAQTFYYYMDMGTLLVQPGDEIEYYFEVWDNDGVMGAKSARSQKQIFKIPTLEELQAEDGKKADDMKEKMTSAIKQARQLQKQVDDMTKKMVEKKEVGWQEKQQIQTMMEKQRNLQQQVEEIKKENTEKNLKQEQYNEFSESIREKQEQLEKLFNDVLPDEMKKMVEELQKLLEQIDKNKIQQTLDQMKLSNEDIEKQLDRDLQLFKQLEVEKKLQQAIDQADKLAEDQKKLAEQTQNSKKEDLPGLQEKQDALNKQFDQLQKTLEELKKGNSELSEPNPIPDTKQEENSAEKEMDNSSQNLKDKKQKESKNSQDNAVQQLQKMSDKLKAAQEQMAQDGAEEDIEALKQILDNLVKISFSQEDLMNQLKVVSTTNPKYIGLVQNQKKLKDDLQMVEDSLFALSKRRAEIAPFVMREINKVQKNSDEAIASLTDRNVPLAQMRQQYVMTSVNNLALMLDESLQQMQKQQMDAKGASSGKKKSKSKKPGQAQCNSEQMKSMRQLQEQLNKQLQDMKDGQKPGDQNPRGSKMSEQMARMAAQQEALRRELQKMGEEMGENKEGTPKGIKEALQKMDETETDIVNKRITQQTIQRQQEIVTRMLESEKALQQREEEERRESHEGKDMPGDVAKRFLEYQKLKTKESEFFRTIPPRLRPFYKTKVDNYFLSVE